MTEDRLKSTIPIPFFFRKFFNDGQKPRKEAWR